MALTWGDVGAILGVVVVGSFVAVLIDTLWCKRKKNKGGKLWE